MTERPGANPRMSVVIPHYNHAHLASEALAAIAQQTMLPFEVVLVDDGSTDDSVVRLQSLAASMPYLRIYRHPENRGVNAACNTGLDLVSGDFVLFSAADDRLSAAMIQHAFAAAAAFPEAGVIFSDHAEMSADGSSTRIVPLDLPTTRRYFSADEFVRLMQNHFFYFHVSSVWFNVALLRELGGFPLDVKWHGDLLAAYAAAFELGAVYTPGRRIVCPHITAVVWRSRLPQQCAAGGSASLATGDQTPRLGAPACSLHQGGDLARLSFAVDPHLAGGPRLHHAWAGKAAHLAIDLDQAGTGLRHRLSSLGSRRPNTIPSLAVAHALRLLRSLVLGRWCGRDRRREGCWTFGFSRHRECSAAQIRHGAGRRVAVQFRA